MWKRTELLRNLVAVNLDLVVNFVLFQLVMGDEVYPDLDEFFLDAPYLDDDCDREQIDIIINYN